MEEVIGQDEFHMNQQRNTMSNPLALQVPKKVKTKALSFAKPIEHMEIIYSSIVTFVVYCLICNDLTMSVSTILEHGSETEILHRF